MDGKPPLEKFHWDPSPHATAEVEPYTPENPLPVAPESPPEEEKTPRGTTIAGYIPERAALAERQPRGDAVLEPKGSRGKGRPETHGLYGRFLGKADRKIYYGAHIGTLDEEIRLAKAKLAWALDRWKKDPDGGVKVVRRSDTKREWKLNDPNRMRLWSDIVLEFMKRVESLEQTQFNITKNQPAPAQTIVNVLVASLNGMTEAQKRAYLTEGRIIDAATLPPAEEKS